MRTWGLLVVLSIPLGCYVGPDETPDEVGGTGDVDSVGDLTTTSGSSDTSSTSDTTSTSDTSSSSDTSSTSDTTSTSDTSSSSDTSMSGCENGALAEPIPGCAPPPPASTGDIHQDCVDRINQLRWECQCLPPLARWTEAETCSDDQSSADQNGGGPHGNFGACGENAQNTCPNWGSEQQVIGGCLQAMWDEGPGEPFSEHGHYINMSSTSYTRVACGFSYDGGVWANQNFRP